MDKKSKIYKYNTGISILKIWMVMSIVVCHFLEVENAPAISRVFTIYGGMAVPVLIFLSFFLTNLGKRSDESKIIHRLYRLILPHVFFTLFYFVVYMFVEPWGGVTKCSDQLRFKDFLLQLFFGSDINPPMWFLVDLIILSILFYSIFYFCKGEKGIIVSIILSGISIWMQYSGINFQQWSIFSDYVKWTMGRLIELIPVATLGVIFSFYEVEKKLLEHRYVIFSGCVVSLILLHRYQFFLFCDGFQYQGIYYLVIACFLSSLFYVFPFEKIPKWVCVLFNKWSSFNVGIIAIHYMVRSMLYTFFGWEQERLSLGKSLLVYGISMFISILGANIPIKIIRKAFT